MPGSTAELSLPYPLPSEVLARQNIVDLADACDFVLSSNDVGRTAALQRTKGLLGSTAANTFTSDSVGYMSWNVDHLDYWSGGGRAITAIQGPTLPTGLYMFTFNATRSAISAAESSYYWVTAQFERAGQGFGLRTFTAAQKSLRISAPVRINAGAAQLIRVRILVNGTVGASTMSFARSNDDAAPRLSWSLVATG